MQNKGGGRRAEDRRQYREERQRLYKSRGRQTRNEDSDRVGGLSNSEECFCDKLTLLSKTVNRTAATTLDAMLNILFESGMLSGLRRLHSWRRDQGSIHRPQRRS